MAGASVPELMEALLVVAPNANLLSIRSHGMFAGLQCDGGGSPWGLVGRTHKGMGTCVGKVVPGMDVRVSIRWGMMGCSLWGGTSWGSAGIGYSGHGGV